MATDWAVTTATERIKLDSQRKASTTFTVSNPGRRPDRVVFDVLPGEGAAESWFSVDQPQRLVQGGASVSYAVETAVPEGVPDGTYSYQAQVYSVDVAPEENSRLSGRVTFDLVNPQPRPKPPWTLIAIVAAAVVALAIVLWLVFSGGSVVVPDVKNKSVPDAVATLQDAGLKAGVRHKQDPARVNLVVAQDPEAGAKVAKGSTVQVHVGVSLRPPAPTEPANGTRFDDRRVPPLKWQAVPDANHYRVTVTTQDCGFTACAAPRTQSFESRSTALTPQITADPNGNTIVTWSVQAIDDAGTPGPPSGQSQFRLGPILIG